MDRSTPIPFTAWYRTLPYGAAAILAKDAGISRSYLSDIAQGKRACGMHVAVKLIAANPDITLGMLRPDLFED